MERSAQWLIERKLAGIGHGLVDRRLCTLPTISRLQFVADNLVVTPNDILNFPQIKKKNIHRYACIRIMKYKPIKYIFGTMQSLFYLFIFHLTGPLVYDLFSPMLCVKLLCQLPLFICVYF